MAPQLSKTQQKVLRVAAATPEEEQDQDLRDEVAAIALLGEAEQALTQAPLTEALIIEGSAKVLEAAQKSASFAEASEALLEALGNKAVAAAAVQGPGSHPSTAALLLYEAAALYAHAMQGLEAEGEPGGTGGAVNRLITALEQERVQAQVQRALGQVGSPVTPGGILARLLDLRIMDPHRAEEAERPWMLDAQQ
jgi:hypothetical protein